MQGLSQIYVQCYTAAYCFFYRDLVCCVLISSLEPDLVYTAVLKVSQL